MYFSFLKTCSSDFVKTEDLLGTAAKQISNAICWIAWVRIQCLTVFHRHAILYHPINITVKIGFKIQNINVLSFGTIHLYITHKCSSFHISHDSRTYERLCGAQFHNSACTACGGLGKIYNCQDCWWSDWSSILKLDMKAPKPYWINE